MKDELCERCSYSWLPDVSDTRVCLFFEKIRPCSKVECDGPLLRTKFPPVSTDYSVIVDEDSSGQLSLRFGSYGVDETYM